MNREELKQPAGTTWRLKDQLCKSLEVSKERTKDKLPPGRVLFDAKRYAQPVSARTDKIKGLCCQCATRKGGGFCPTVNRHVRRKQTQCGQLQPKGAK